MFKLHSIIFLMVVLVQAKNQYRGKLDDSEKTINDRIDKENANFDDSERRFMDGLNDAEWHVAHLKSTDFENTRRVGEENCKEETYADKVKRYRKSLKNDAGRLEYVYAHPLTVDEKEMDEYKCEPKDKKENKTAEEHVNKTVTAHNETSANVTKKDTVSSTTGKDTIDVGEAPEDEGKVTLSDEEDASLKPINNNVFKPHVMNQATTKKPEEIEKDRDARRGDYLFSSVEYDDDVVDFDISECPDVVDVIILEQDIIRPYDVECELSIIWQSLE